MKTLKIYLKNCPESSNTKIYCIKHDIGENLENLKEKIFLRVPQLRFAGIEPIIYWFDLENDKIRINCDDDLKFFMEESEIRKLTFEYRNQQESSRKRRSTTLVDYDIDDDIHSECSKRLRKIDLSSDSSMDTDSGGADDEVRQDSNSSDVPMPSTSQSADNAPKVNIISIETIEPVEAAAEAEADTVNNNQIENQVVVVEEENSNSNNTTDSGNETSNEEQPKPTDGQRGNSESNRIVISDSSDDDDDNNNGNDNNYYGNNHNSSYSYSFANAGVYGARNRPHENSRNFFNNMRQAHQRRVMRNIEENVRFNIMRGHENAREGIRVARASIENARSIQNQMLQNFRAHFQPLFYSNFSSTYRR